VIDQEQNPDAERPFITKDSETGLPLIECRRTPPPAEELTPERMAEILLAQDVARYRDASGIDAGNLVAKGGAEMGKYGIVAVGAANRLKSGTSRTALEAWQAEANKAFPESPSLQQKGCPRGAFLGLCEAGYIDGVPGETATVAGINGEYAIEAVRLLSDDATLATIGPAALWRKTSGGDKAHNRQMDVVLALWNAKLIRTT
jgi:hypothetical protein